MKKVVLILYLVLLSIGVFGQSNTCMQVWINNQVAYQESIGHIDSIRFAEIDTTDHPVVPVLIIPATVAQIIDIADRLDPGAQSDVIYSVKGIVTDIPDSIENQDGNIVIDFTLTDATSSISCHNIRYNTNQSISSLDQILSIGDTVEILAYAKNNVDFNTGLTSLELVNGSFVSISRKTDPEGRVIIQVNVAEVVDIINALEPGTQTTEYYQVSGTVVSVSTSINNLVSYGNINFTLRDSTGAIGCYSINYLKNKRFTSPEQILVVGDIVTVVAHGKKYANQGDGQSPIGLVDGYLQTINGESIDAISATIAEVINVCNTQQPGSQSTKLYKVSGIVSAVATSADDVVKYGNLNFTLQDETGAIGCYYIYYLDSATFTSADQILNVGDTVTVLAYAKSYVNKNTGKVTPELYQGFLLDIRKNSYVAQVIDATFSDIMNVMQNLAQGATTLDAYRVMGIVSAVTTAKNKVVGYGNCTFNIADPTNTITENIVCYYTNYLNNQQFTDSNDIPCVGDTVVVIAPLQNYNGKAELFKGYIDSISRNTPEQIIVDDDSNLDVPAGTLTCAEAITIGMQLNDRTATAETYYIKGVVIENITTGMSINTYGNMTFYMVDDITDTARFQAYQVFGSDSTRFIDMQQVVPGNVVVLKSKIYRYGNQIETEGAGKAYIYSTTNAYVDTTSTNPNLPEGTQQELNFAANCFNLATVDTITVSKAYTLGEVTLTVSKGNAVNNPQVLTYLYRMYKNSNFSLSVPAGKNIKYVAITTAGGDKGADLLSADSGTIAVDSFKDGVWTGQANTITFSNTGQVRIMKLLIVYE